MYADWAALLGGQPLTLLRARLSAAYDDDILYEELEEDEDEDDDEDEEEEDEESEESDDSDAEGESYWEPGDSSDEDDRDPGDSDRGFTVDRSPYGGDDDEDSYGRPYATDRYESRDSRDDDDSRDPERPRSYYDRDLDDDGNDVDREQEREAERVRRQISDDLEEQRDELSERQPPERDAWWKREADDEPQATPLHADSSEGTAAQIRQSQHAPVAPSMPPTAAPQPQQQGPIASMLDAAAKNLSQQRLAQERELVLSGKATEATAPMITAILADWQRESGRKAPNDKDPRDMANFWRYSEDWTGVASDHAPNTLTRGQSDRKAASLALANLQNERYQTAQTAQQIQGRSPETPGTPGSGQGTRALREGGGPIANIVPPMPPTSAAGFDSSDADYGDAMRQRAAVVSRGGAVERPTGAVERPDTAAAPYINAQGQTVQHPVSRPPASPIAPPPRPLAALSPEQIDQLQQQYSTAATTPAAPSTAGMSPEQIDQMQQTYGPVPLQSTFDSGPPPTQWWRHDPMEAVEDANLFTAALEALNQPTLSRQVLGAVAGAAKDIVGSYARLQVLNLKRVQGTLTREEGIEAINTAKELSMIKVGIPEIRLGAQAAKASGHADDVVAKAKSEFERMFHGTASAFDTPQVSNGLAARGYHLAANPNTAADYGNLHQRVGDIEWNIASVRNPGSAGVERTSGANIRPVDVPNNLKILDIDTPQGSAIYQRAGGATDVAATSDNLAAQGYDGIRHVPDTHVTPGDRSPELVIFEPSLPKLRNAISGTPAGLAIPGAALGGAAAQAQVGAQPVQLSGKWSPEQLDQMQANATPPTQHGPYPHELAAEPRAQVATNMQLPLVQQAAILFERPLDAAAEVILATQQGAAQLGRAPADAKAAVAHALINGAEWARPAIETIAKLAYWVESGSAQGELPQAAPKAYIDSWVTNWASGVPVHLAERLNNQLREMGVEPPTRRPAPGAITGPIDMSQRTAKGTPVSLVAHPVFQASEGELGKPYIWGGDRAGRKGWDCSSFVSDVMQRAYGVKVTPYTDAAFNETDAVTPGQERPGDIVFFEYRDSSQPNARIPHMGIYVGPGQMLDAQSGKGVGYHPFISGTAHIRRARGMPGMPEGPPQNPAFRPFLEPERGGSVQQSIRPPSGGTPTALAAAPVWDDATTRDFIKTRVLGDMPAPPPKPLASVEQTMQAWKPTLDWMGQQTGLPPEHIAGLILAENGFGQSDLSRNDNNYFSLSAVKGNPWQQPTDKRFARYATPQDGIANFIWQMASPESYQNRGSAASWKNRKDLGAWVQNLVKGGYIKEEPGFPVSTWIKNIQAGADKYRKATGGR